MRTCALSKPFYSARVPKVLPLVMAMLFAQQSFAQSATAGDEKDDSTKTLENVEVVGTRIKMTEIGGYASTLRETPQSVTVIDREQLEKQNLFTLDDVMMATPGIVVAPDTSDEYYYYIRGQEVNSFQWDGLTMESFAYLNNSPNMAMFEQVQVLRGANGVLNAAKSFGSVNLIRKRPLEYFKASGGVSYGSWNNFHIEADVTGPLTKDGRLRGRAVASYGDRDYFFDVAKRRENLFYGILEYDITPDTLATLAVSRQDMDSTPFIYGLPRFVDGSGLGVPRSTFLGSDWNHFGSASTNVFATIEHKFENGWSIKLAGSTLDAESEYKYSYVGNGTALGTDASTIPAFDPITDEANTGSVLTGNASEYVFDQKVLDLSAQGTFDLFGRQHELLIGASYYENDYAYNYVSLLGLLYQPVNVFNWDPSSVAEPVTPGWSWVGPNWRDTWRGVYATGRFHLSDRLTLTAGARATWFTHRFSEYYYGSLENDEDTKENAVITPYAGLVYDLNSTWSVYTSYADIFTAQTAQTIDGDTLKPVIGANYELGIKGELLGGRLNGSFAVFRVEKTNEAMEDLRYDPLVDPQPFYVATGKTRSEGAELEISGRPIPSLTIAGGYTYNTTEVIKGDEGVGQPYATWVPKHMLRLWTDYKLPFADERWSIGGSLTAQNRVERPTGDPDVSISQGGYAILGLRVGFRLSDGWSLGLNVDNLTDKTYYTKTGSSVNCCNFYGAPRSVMLSLRGEL